MARRWAAPEVLCFNAYSSCSDVWSFAIAMYEAFQAYPGSQPFYFIAQIAKLGEKYTQEDTTQEVVAELMKELARSCPGDIRQLIGSCLVYDKHKRPAFGDVVLFLTDALEGSGRWDFPRDNLKFVAMLGSGAFGKVEQYTASGLGPKPIDVAVKSNTNTKENERFLNEINIMKTMRHPHIVQMLASCVTGGTPLMILEYMPHGSLDHYLRESKKKHSPIEMQTMIFQVG